MFDKAQILQAIYQIVFGILGAVIVQLAFIHHTQKLVTVDITGIVKSFESEVLKQNLSTDEVSKKISKFGKALNAAVESYSSNNNYILVPKEVVIAGAVDDTNDVKDNIKKRLNT